MCTTEYALGTVSACGFACVLLTLLPHLRGMLMQILASALELRFGWPVPGFSW